MSAGKGGTQNVRTPGNREAPQLGDSATRQQIVDELNAMRVELEDCKRRMAALERRVARQEQRAATTARGGVR